MTRYTANPTRRHPTNAHYQHGAMLLTLVVVALAGCTTLSGVVSGPTMTPPPPSGTRVDPPIDLPPITLTNQYDEAVSLSDFAGRPVLVYFGYTYCPDVCPVTLADFKRVALALDDQAGEVSFVFITVDIRRDPPARLREYLAAFNPDFIGLTTADEDLLQEATQAFGVYYELEEVTDTQAEYLVAHTSSSFLLNEAGQISLIYAYQTPPDVIAADIRDMLAEG